MAGLVPAIPLSVARLCIPYRDRRDKPGDDDSGLFMIRITDKISIDESELEESFVRASGPGGQHVNKTETAVQLRFDVRRSPSLPNDVAVRLMQVAGSRMTQDGVLVLTAQSERSQKRNREEA